MAQVSRLELGHDHNTDLATQYEQWLVSTTGSHVLTAAA
jgi:hypothetical protein